MLRQFLAAVREGFTGRAPSAPGGADRAKSAAQLREAAGASAEALLTSLQSGPTGLLTDVAEGRLKTHGLNEVAHERAPPWYLQLWHGFANAFSALLTVLATVSWVTGDHESALIIAAMVLLSGLLRFFQERRAGLAAQKLQEMVRVTCTVIRHDASGTAAQHEIPIRDLVPGDVVKLSAGDMIPADVRPQTECLKDVVERMLPYWYDAIIPDLAAGRTTLVVAHGNSLRALVKHLDGISDADIAELNIPTGMPLVYELTGQFAPVQPGGRYLDPEAAAQAAEAVRSQGR